MPEHNEDKPKMGRPQAVLDWQQIGQMAAILCTKAEIASICGVHLDTLYSRCLSDNGESFPEWYDRHANGGRQSLRRAQYTSAIKGNSVMLRWLGANWLGQSEKQETTTTVQVAGFEVIPEQDDQE